LSTYFTAQITVLRLTCNYTGSIIIYQHLNFVTLHDQLQLIQHLCSYHHVALHKLDTVVVINIIIMFISFLVTLFCHSST